MRPSWQRRLSLPPTGFLFAEDGVEGHIAEGAGTIAKELTDALGESAGLDALILPLGNGALLTGMATWVRSVVPRCHVIGVVAAMAPAMKLSWQQGRTVTTRCAPTMADGIAVRVPVPYALRSIQGIVDDVVAVDESTIAQAMQFCLTHHGLVVEPAGAVGVAALLAEPARWRGKTIGTVFCGGNVALNSDCNSVYAIQSNTTLLMRGETCICYSHR